MYTEEQTSSLASALLKAQLLSRPLETRGASCRSFMNASLWLATLVCAHDSATLSNRGPSELVEERIFYALHTDLEK